MKTVLWAVVYCALLAIATCLYAYIPVVSGGLTGLFVFLILCDILVYKYGKRTIASLIPRRIVLKLGVSPVIAFIACSLWLIGSGSFLSSFFATISWGISMMGMGLAVVARNSLRKDHEAEE